MIISNIIYDRSEFIDINWLDSMTWWCDDISYGYSLQCRLKIALISHRRVPTLHSLTITKRLLFTHVLRFVAIYRPMCKCSKVVSKKWWIDDNHKSCTDCHTRMVINLFPANICLPWEIYWISIDIWSRKCPHLFSLFDLYWHKCPNCNLRMKSNCSIKWKMIKKFHNNH